MLMKIDTKIDVDNALLKVKTFICAKNVVESAIIDAMKNNMRCVPMINRIFEKDEFEVKEDENNYYICLRTRNAKVFKVDCNDVITDIKIPKNGFSFKGAIINGDYDKIERRLKDCGLGNEVSVRKHNNLLLVLNSKYSDYNHAEALGIPRAAVTDVSTAQTDIMMVIDISKCM